VYIVFHFLLFYKIVNSTIFFFFLFNLNVDINTIKKHNFNNFFLSFSKVNFYPFFFISPLLVYYVENMFFFKGDVLSGRANFTFIYGPYKV